jgi:septal ring factor EnvC (AmiA/AmiB activator)
MRPLLPLLAALGVLAASALGARAGEWTPPRYGEGTAAGRADTTHGGDTESERLSDELAALGRQSTERQALTVARGRAYVRLARAGLLPLSGGLEALAAHASRLERLRRALGRDLMIERRIAARRIQVARELQELEARPASEREALARAQNAIEAAQERDEAFRRAFQSDWDPGDRTAVYGANSPPSALRASGGFAAQRGRLPFPLAGRSEIQKVRSPTGEGKAVLMLSSGGTKVRAVYPGRVAFADDYPNLGNTVIVDHGGHFYTVSAHLQRIAVEVGEEIASGQQIGTVGNYGQKTGLLFEVRSGQSTVDTPEWFGI